MSNYRRAKIAGGMYFFTVVTENRAPIFHREPIARMLGRIIREAQRRWPFRVPAVVLLPDHLHAIWSLPRGDFAYSMRWGWIKKEFTQAYLKIGGSTQPVSMSQQKNRRAGVWQRKFWERSIRDEEEFAAYLDYIHWNPVKHGHVQSPSQWPFSTFHRWVAKGQYHPDWGTIPPDVQRFKELSTGE